MNKPEVNRSTRSPVRASTSHSSPSKRSYATICVPSDDQVSLDKDLDAAGIQKYAPAGKLDFHACRVAYINLVIEAV